MVFTCPNAWTCKAEMFKINHKTISALGLQNRTAILSWWLRFPYWISLVPDTFLIINVLKKLAVLHAAKLQALESQQQWLRPDRQAVKAGSSSVSSDERHEDGNRSCSATVGSQVEHEMHYRRRVGIAAAFASPPSFNSPTRRLPSPPLPFLRNHHHHLKYRNQLPG